MACRRLVASRSGGKPACPVTWRRTMRRVRMNDMRNGSSCSWSVASYIQCSDRVVGQQQRPDFLVHHLGALRAQHAVAAALAGFDLGETGLEFPPLVIDRGELTGGGQLGIEDGGDQPGG